MFLLKFSSYLARRIYELTEWPANKRFWFATLVISHLFADVSARNEGFGEFGAVGSFHKKAQDYFLKAIWGKIVDKLPQFYGAIGGYYPGITTGNIHPYMRKSAAPNVFSFFHLAYQSLKNDFVLPLLIALIT